MSVSKMDKVLLGITVVIATVAAGAVRVWMAFPVLIVGLIASVVLVRLLDSKLNKKRGSAAKLISGADGDQQDFGIDSIEQARRRRELDPAYSNLSSNVWHERYLHRHDDR